MFGFAFALGCALGLFALSRTHHGRRGMRGFFSHAFSRLGTTPGQEQVIRSAFLQVRDGAKEVARDLRSSRPELAEVLTKEEFDEQRVEQWLSDRERAFAQVKPQMLDSLREIHGVLDTDQRRKLAKWIETGSGRLFPFGGHNGRWGHVC